MVSATVAASPEEQIKRLGIVLPRQPRPVAAYVNARQTGKLVFVSGQGPVAANGELMRGKVGADVTAEEAREHARLTGLNILAVLREFCGSLDRVASVVKLLGLVNAVPEFEEHPYVIDGCSTLLGDIFGESGLHARSAMGMGSLPNMITVEIESIFELRD